MMDITTANKVKKIYDDAKYLTSTALNSPVSGSIGKTIQSNLDTTVSSRSSQTSVNAIANNLDEIPLSKLVLKVLKVHTFNNSQSDTYTVPNGKIAKIYSVSLSWKGDPNYTIALTIAGTTYISFNPPGNDLYLSPTAVFSFGGRYFKLTAGQTVVLTASSGSNGDRDATASLGIVEENA